MNSTPRPRLMTSSLKKIAEFQFLGLDVEIGGPSPDLKEPLADPLFIAAHKAYTSGIGSLCEDTRLDVQGARMGVEARFFLEALPTLAGRRAVFACCLALSVAGECLVWEARVEGSICAQRGSDGFGFDPFFEPDGSAGLNLSELAALGRKHEYSARARVCSAFASQPSTARFAHAHLAAYDGPWQGG